MRYEGNDPARRETVRDYLAANYDVTTTRAEELIEINHPALATGVRMGSYAYYVGDQIAKAAGLSERPQTVPDEENRYSTRDQPVRRHESGGA